MTQNTDTCENFDADQIDPSGGDSDNGPTDAELAIMLAEQKEERKEWEKAMENSPHNPDNQDNSDHDDCDWGDQADSFAHDEIDGIVAQHIA